MEMMTRIVALTNKYPFLGFFIKIICRIVLSTISKANELSRWLRSKGLGAAKYEKIKALRDIHKGKRCFIICTGPSLTISDLELISHEITFGMNSLPLFYTKTSFRPTYYGCMDEDVFLRMKNEIHKFDTPQIPVFLSNRAAKHEKRLSQHWYVFPGNVAYHTYDRWFKGEFWCKFSDDAYKGLYDMYSITHALIQIAVYMGFHEIYLLGADCNQKPGAKNHAIESGVVDTTIDTSRERNICGYEEVKRYCDTHNVTVYNATRGGELEVFERVKLDSVIH